MNKKINIWHQRENFASKVLLISLVVSIVLSFFLENKTSIEGILSYISLGILNASFIVFIIFKSMNLIEKKEKKINEIVSVALNAIICFILLYIFWFKLSI